MTAKPRKMEQYLAEGERLKAVVRAYRQERAGDEPPVTQPAFEYGKCNNPAPTKPTRLPPLERPTEIDGYPLNPSLTSSAMKLQPSSEVVDAIIDGEVIAADETGRHYWELHRQGNLLPGNCEQSEDRATTSRNRRATRKVGLKLEGRNETLLFVVDVVIAVQRDADMCWLGAIFSTGSR